MSRHATFENFGMAFLTLFQVSTGDNWNGIMKVFPVYSQTSPCLPFHFISTSRATPQIQNGARGGECLSAEFLIHLKLFLHLLGDYIIPDAI